MEYIIKQLHFAESELLLQQLVNLQNAVYAGRHTFTQEGFRRWYLENPMGEVISFNAFYGEELVAHYACIPYKMKIEGRVVVGLFDMATVTHPNHRGKGLFKRLAQITYDYAKTQGYEFVLGVANANSFPGYMKYFPFTFVSRLDVKIGIGTNIHPNGEKKFSTYWDIDTLNWRMNCCKANYSRNGNDMLGQYNSMVQTYMGYFPKDLLDCSDIINKHWGWRPKLYVGLGACIRSPYMRVPKFIKRSPFNLMFLDLTGGKLPVPTKNNVFFQLFDFDVA